MMNAFGKYGYDKIQIIENSIEIGKYHFRIRTECRPRLLWVRSFHEVYNPIMAVNVLGRLVRVFPEAKLCMVGPDKDGSLDACRSYAEAQGLISKIEFAGRMSKDEWLTISNAYDIFLNTTNVDNTPVSVIEAMALGLPVISTKVGGVEYLIDHGDTGLLVAVGDEESMFESILRLMIEPGLASHLSMNARKSVEAFDWKEVRHKWFALLDPFELKHLP
jgi:glycosyltransferase involved in cell wall biosynthesis